MSDDKPTITVTRGKRGTRSRKTSSSSARSQSSSGLNLPGPGAVISGIVRGVRNTWWASLGLLAVARDAGSQVFEALVEEGRSWEQAQRIRRNERAKRVQKWIEERGTVEAAEERVREEINNALHRVGVPHRDDLDDLRDQIDTLGKRVETLQAEIADAEAKDEM